MWQIEAKWPNGQTRSLLVANVENWKKQNKTAKVVSAKPRQVESAAAPRTALDASPFDRDSDVGSALMILRAKAEGAAAIVKRTGFSKSFVDDVLAGKFGTNESAIRRAFKADAKATDEAKKFTTREMGDTSEGETQLAAAEAEITRTGRALRLAQEAKDRPAVRAATVEYEKVRSEYDRLFNLQQLAKINAGRSMKAEREHAAMLRAFAIKRLNAKDVMPVGDEYVRKYPSYTTEQLEKSVAAGQGNEAMIEEIAARKDGRSKPKVTPQLAGGKVVTKVGRM